MRHDEYESEYKVCSVYHSLLGRAKSVLTLEYMAPFSTSPFLIQMMEAAGLALSAWHVRFNGSPALRLTTGPPSITGLSGGTASWVKEKKTSCMSVSGRALGDTHLLNWAQVNTILYESLQHATHFNKPLFPWLKTWWLLQSSQIGDAFHKC